jgi:hypothetical protein
MGFDVSAMAHRASCGGLLENERRLNPQWKWCRSDEIYSKRKGRGESRGFAGVRSKQLLI